MKRMYFLGLLLILSVSMKAQQAKPEILKGPANWEFERFPLPPQFAPQIKYTGFEELRFAPGMFKKDSANYFTYAFVAAIDGLPEIGVEAVHSYLFNYYRGLCASVANEKKHPIDSTQIEVKMDPGVIKPTDGIFYRATADVIGVFDDWAPVKLNIEVKLMKDLAGEKTYLFILASPQSFGTGIWEQLYMIRQQAKLQ